MKYYKVMPKWKNSVFEFTNYENEDKTISFETEHQDEDLVNLIGVSAP